jgi:anti-sigma factor RsiW
MKCNDVQQRLKAYLDNELTGRDVEAISSHIKSCPSCSKEAALLSRTWEMLLELPGTETVPDLVPATLSRIQEESDATLLQRFSRLLLPAPTPAFAAIALILGLFIGARLGTLISTGNAEPGTSEDPLYLEIFQELPPESIGDAYIQVNYGKGDEDL